MHHQRSLSQQKSSIERLFYSILPKKSSKSNDLTDKCVQKDTRNASSSDMTCCSSSVLKKYDEGKSDQRTSTNTTSDDQVTKHSINVNSNLGYTPMCRRYFGLSPPNPLLYNRRLREDYIDWYMNVYLGELEQIPWRHFNSSRSTADGVKSRNREVQQESRKVVFTSSASSKNNHRSNRQQHNYVLYD